MCCIALVRCVLVLRCGSAGVVWYPYAGWRISASAVTPAHIEPEQYNTWNKSTIIRKLLKMDVVTIETCWAVNSEITKQVTSSWSIFIQLWGEFMFLDAGAMASRMVSWLVSFSERLRHIWCQIISWFNSLGPWRWCMTHWHTLHFWILSIVRIFNKTRRFGNRLCFRLPKRHVSFKQLYTGQSTKKETIPAIS